ncbi:MAG: cobalamin-dependent protein, partial [Planctomycetota bacterium]
MTIPEHSFYTHVLLEKEQMQSHRHVLCVYPYRVELGRRNGFYPPLGLEFVASALQPHFQAIDVVDLRHESGNAVDFLRPETDLVCFSVNWDREADSVREQILSVPPEILTIVGGRHVTEDPEKWLSMCPNIDVLVRGDGEEIAVEIVEGRPLEEIAGISYRLDGRLAHNPVRQCSPVRDDLYPD